MWKAAWSVGSFLKHRDTEAQRDLRELCDSVFPKSAQGRLFGLCVFFETQRHRGTERGQGRVREGRTDYSFAAGFFRNGTGLSSIVFTD